MLKLDHSFIGRPDKKYWPGLLRDFVEKRRAGGEGKTEAVVSGIYDLKCVWGIIIDSPKDLV